jgi:hypothetical protein
MWWWTEHVYDLWPVAGVTHNHLSPLVVGGSMPADRETPRSRRGGHVAWPPRVLAGVVRLGSVVSVLAAPAPRRVVRHRRGGSQGVEVDQVVLLAAAAVAHPGLPVEDCLVSGHDGRHGEEGEALVAGPVGEGGKVLGSPVRRVRRASLVGVGLAGSQQSPRRLIGGVERRSRRLESCVLNRLVGGLDRARTASLLFWYACMLNSCST